MAARLTGFIVVAIVAVTIVAGLIVGAQRDDNGPVDLIVFNGRVYRGSQNPELAEAVAVRGNQILRVGSNREIKRLRRIQTTVVDAHGAAVLPGFVDSRVDLLNSWSVEDLDLADTRTPGEVQERIRAFAAAHPDRAWIDGRGWRYDTFPSGLPTRRLLDEIVPDRPVRLVSADGHTTWVNSKGLELAGIGSRTPNPRNGVVVKDPRTGEPTGILKEAAQRLLDPLVPDDLAAGDWERALARGVREAHRHGVTSVHTTGGTPEDLERLHGLRRDGELALRIYADITVSPDTTEADADRLDALRRRIDDDAVLKAGLARIAVDGIVETHTAHLLEPYANRATNGRPALTADELTRLVAMFDARGWQVALDASGDAAVRQALDALEQGAAANPAPARGRRHRVEHVEIVDPIDVGRFGPLGAIASMQPARANTAERAVWTANLGSDRAPQAWCWNSLVASSGRLAFGSDWPAAPFSPIPGIAVAVTRTTETVQPEGAPDPGEKMPLTGAIDAYTSGGAYASFDELRKGLIEPGMLADLVILSTDIFSLPPERLHEPTVETTIFDGKVVYSREPAETEP
jgi:predicted amidohydrolase YtcJ